MNFFKKICISLIIDCKFSGIGIPQSVRTWKENGWMVLLFFLVVIGGVISVIIYSSVKKNKTADDLQNQDGLSPHAGNRQTFGIAVSKLITLIITGANGVSRYIDVEVKNSFFVGRSEMCNLVFHDQLMSRRHFVIEYETGQFYISDLNTTNGTFLNGLRFKGRLKLSDRDVITAGDETFVFNKH